MTKQHILISQIKNIGDVVLALPMARLIREHYPDAIVSLLGTGYTQSIILGCSDVQKSWDWDELQHLSDDDIAQQWHDEKITTIIHVSHNYRIAKIGKKARIACRIGTLQRWYHWIYCNRWINQSRRHSCLHEIELNLKLLKLLGVGCVESLDVLGRKMNVKPHHVLPASIESLLVPDKFNLILHPGSNGHGREWPSIFFEQLISQLPSDKIRIFLTGSRQEQERFAVLIQNSPVSINVMGKMTLDEFIMFVSRVDGIVASGTGPLHLAAAMGIKALGLFPPRHGVNTTRWAPIGPQTTTLTYDRPCYEVCFLCRKSDKCACMAKISVDQVLSVILKWLPK